MQQEQVAYAPPRDANMRPLTSLSSAMLPSARAAAVIGLRPSNTADEPTTSPVERLKQCLNELDTSLRARDEQDAQAARVVEARIRDLETRLSEAQAEAAGAKSENSKLQAQLQAAALTISAHEATIEEQKATIENSIAVIKDATARAAQSSKLAEWQDRQMRVLLNMPPSVTEVPRQ